MLLLTAVHLDLARRRAQGAIGRRLAAAVGEDRESGLSTVVVMAIITAIAASTAVVVAVIFKNLAHSWANDAPAAGSTTAPQG